MKDWRPVFPFLGGGGGGGNGRKRRQPPAVLLSLLVGIFVGIYNFSRLTSVAISNDLSSLSFSSPLSDHSSLEGGAAGTKVTMTTTSTTNTTRAETLFPPYMFYTANNYESLGEVEKSYQRQCQEMNPSYEVRFYDDGSSREFVSRHYPQFLSLYDDLDMNVMRADVWRYLILHHYGGVYFDFDVDCRRPIDEWGEAFGVYPNGTTAAANNATTIMSIGKGTGENHRIGAMVGIEFRRPLNVRTSNYPDRLQFVQWTLASQPRHDIYYRTVELVNETVASMRAGADPPGDAVYITGPVAFSRAVVEHLVRHGRLRWDQIVDAPPGADRDVLVDDPTITSRTDMLVGDVAVLHEDAFAYRKRNGNVAGMDGNHSSIYARHWYSGRWKEKGWKLNQQVKGWRSNQLQKKNVERTTASVMRVVEKRGRI